MPPRKPTLDVLEARVEERHLENQRRFDVQDEKLDRIEGSVNSLLQTRSFSKGVWKVVAVISTAIAAIMGWKS